MKKLIKTFEKGFTLIELLIVIAIIAILAAIAIPNFLQAQTRSKVSRVKGELRSIATALEAYYVDYNDYPLNQDIGLGGAAWFFIYEGTRAGLSLTTPVSYITKIPRDQFFYAGGGMWYPYRYVKWTYPTQTYSAPYWMAPMPGPGQSIHGLWLLGSCGPDRAFRSFYAIRDGTETPPTGTNPLYIYDPTNGTISNGDIFRQHKPLYYPD